MLRFIDKSSYLPTDPTHFLLIILYSVYICITIKDATKKRRRRCCAKFYPLQDKDPIILTYFDFPHPYSLSLVLSPPGPSGHSTTPPPLLYIECISYLTKDEKGDKRSRMKRRNQKYYRGMIKNKLNWNRRRNGDLFNYFLKKTAPSLGT